VFVATYRLLPVGAHVALRVALPDGEVVAKGTVRWVRDVASGASPGLGIAFDRLDADTAQRLEHFCAARPPLLHEEDALST
jgi:Tfp pilus assembly protein PilZ